MRKYLKSAISIAITSVMLWSCTTSSFALSVTNVDTSASKTVVSNETADNSAAALTAASEKVIDVASKPVVTKNKIVDDGVASSKLGYVVSELVVNGETITADVLMADGRVTLTTKKLDKETLELRTSKGDEQLQIGTVVDVAYDKHGKVVDFSKMFDLPDSAHSKGMNYSKYNVWFDTIKYGAEFRPAKGKVGNAIAAGWLLDKTGSTIMVGDTNRFEETYKLSNNVKVYNLDTEEKTLKEISMNELPVTQKTDGLYSMTSLRQPVVVVFDKNYKNYKNAKVTEIYYLTPASQIEDKYCVPVYDTMSQYSSYGDYEVNNDGIGGRESKLDVTPWAGYTKPFTIYPGKLISVSDNDVFMALIIGENGKLYLLDTSYPLVFYNICLTIAEAGYDPRDLDGVFVTHGHGDHYGTLNQLNRMISYSGGDLDVWNSNYDTVGLSSLGYPDFGPTYDDAAVRADTDNYYEKDSWLDMGNGVRIHCILTPGHTQGCFSFVFECTDEDGKVTTFGYIGGMGTRANPNMGVTRLQFLFMLRYMQQNSTCDYALPQHVGHFPILEINKAGEAAGLTFMEAELTGEKQWINYLERRTELQSYASLRLAWLEDPVMDVTLADGTVKTIEMKSSSPDRITNEEAGPWKREAGEYTITTLDSGKIIQGFDGRENANPLFAGVKNLSGDDMSNGILSTRDGYVHNPDAWYVQVSMRVDDAYDGLLMNLPNAINGPIDITTCKPIAKSTNGPIERLMLGDDWYEINRTLAFSSEEDAQKVLDSIEAGKSYKVYMDRDSNIVITDNIMDTFRLTESVK